MYVRYDEPLWHCRLVLCHVKDAKWVVLSPDFDMFVEELTSTNSDLSGVQVGRHDGSPPASLAAAPLYTFGADDLPRGSVLREWIDEAQAVAVLEGWGQADPAGARSWVFDESRGGVKAGDLFGGSVDTILGDRGLVDVGGDVILVELADKARRAELQERSEATGGSGDARVLPVRYDENGVQGRPWGEAARCSEETVIENWPTKGPRTAGWVGRFLSRRNTGPDDHHRWWRSTARLGWGVSAHAQCCRYLQLAGSFDQLDLSNNSIIEAVARRLQVIEWQYRDRVRDGDRGLAGATSAGSASGITPASQDEVDLFEGTSHVGSTVCCCPDLVEHVSRELEREAQIQKNARKAREEKQLARAPPASDRHKGGGRGGRERGMKPRMPPEDGLSVGLERIARLGATAAPAGRSRHSTGIDRRSFVATSAPPPPPLGLSALPTTPQEWQARLISDGLRACSDLVRGGSRKVDTSLDTSLSSPVTSASLAARCAEMSSPLESLAPADAFEQLTKGSDYHGQPWSSVPLNEGLLSLRPPGTSPRELSDLLGPAGRHLVEQWKIDHVLQNQDAVRQVQEAGVRVYHDPGLRRAPRRYARLIRRLIDSGMLEIVPGEVVACAGLFAVSKKSGRQRLVVDCRESNCWFSASPSVSLPTAAGLTRMRMRDERRHSLRRAVRLVRRVLPAVSSGVRPQDVRGPAGAGALLSGARPHGEGRDLAASLQGRADGMADGMEPRAILVPNYRWGPGGSCRTPLPSPTSPPGASASTLTTSGSSPPVRRAPASCCSRPWRLSVTQGGRRSRWRSAAAAACWA